MAAKRGAFWPWFLCGLAVALFVGIVVLAARIGSHGGTFRARGEQRVVLDDEDDEKGVFVEIGVEGVIVDAAVGGANPVESLASALERAGEESDLRGLLLRVNSPGGGIRASAVMLKALLRFKAEHEVPIVVWMKDVAASGGYYVSMAADHIVAHEDTITASIGVIWQNLNWKVLMEEKLGLRFDVTKSAEMKDIGSPNREMTAEERALIQSFVDEAYDEFLSVVEKGRAGKGVEPVTKESLRALKSTILGGRRAYQAGLVDQLGYREDAVAKLKELAGIARADVVEYRRPKGLLDSLLGVRAASDPAGLLLERLRYLHTEGPALLALWER
jgi:signal peptide peptidase SppA